MHRSTFSHTMVPRTPTKRGAVIGYADAGLSPIEIARRLGWPPSTVKTTIKRYQKHGTVYNLPRSGRPPLFDLRGERQILFHFLRMPRLSFGEIAQHYDCSEATIQRIAKKHGYARRIMRKVVNLTPQQVRQRFKWAEDNVRQDWNRIIFTDEMSVELGAVSREWTTRRDHEAYKQRHLQVKFQSGRQSIMVWGAMSKNRKWPLVLLPTNTGITAIRYSQEVLPRLAAHARELRRKIWQPALVVEDNAPIHNANLTNATRTQLKLERLPHPPGLPDLNPIENIWAIVKHNVYKRFPKATNAQTLFQHVQEAWDDVPMEVVRNVIDSMEARRLSVIAAKGKQTRY